MMKPNSWPEKQHDHLQGELKGQRNLERLQSDVIKYINMFSHLPARTKLYECLCCREDAGMWKIVKWNESCHQGAADWFWPPAKRALIGCWPLNATAPQFSGVELIMLIAKDWKTNMCILKQKDILACLPLIRLSTALADTWAQLKNTAASSWITNYGLSWKQCHTPTKRRSRMPYLPRLISGVAYKNVHKVKIHSKWKSMQLECAVQRVKFHPKCLNLEALQSHLGGSDNEDGWQWHAEVRHNVT